MSLKKLKIIDLNAFHGAGEKVLNKLCAWLNIRYESSLGNSTVMGVQWFGNASNSIAAKTFSKQKEKLHYLKTLGEEGGLTISEFKIATYISKSISTSLGYNVDDCIKFKEIIFQIIEGCLGNKEKYLLDKTFLTYKKNTYESIILRYLPHKLAVMFSRLFLFFSKNLVKNFKIMIQNLCAYRILKIFLCIVHNRYFLNKNLSKQRVC